MSEFDHTIQGTVYNYRYIDHGAQYRVYAISTMDGAETGRVIKVPLSFGESKHVLLPHLEALNLAPEEIDRRIHQLMIRKQQLPRLLQGMFAKDKQLMRLLGELQIVPILTKPPHDAPEYFVPLYFTQEYAMPMAKFMHAFRFMQVKPRATLEDARQAKQLMHAIVKLHYRLWEYGIADITFKLENIGVLMRGNTVEQAILVDGAEHTLDFEVAKDVLNQQKWRYCLDPIKTDHLFLPTVLHDAYANLLSKELTVEALQKHWQKKSQAAERKAVRAYRIRQIVTRSPQKSLALWVEQQSLRSNLHRGIPAERVDTSRIPRDDLILLLQDSRVSKLPLSTIARQENAERAAHTNNNTVAYEIFRHALGT